MMRTRVEIELPPVWIEVVPEAGEAVPTIKATMRHTITTKDADGRKAKIRADVPVEVLT